MTSCRCTFPSEATGDELRAYFRAHDDWAIRARYHFAWVFDLSNVTMASATQRKGDVRQSGTFPRASVKVFRIDDRS
jgi:hypothetical protein